MVNSPRLNASASCSWPFRPAGLITLDTPSRKVPAHPLPPQTKAGFPGGGQATQTARNAWAQNSQEALRGVSEPSEQKRTLGQRLSNKKDRWRCHGVSLLAGTHPGSCPYGPGGVWGKVPRQGAAGGCWEAQVSCRGRGPPLGRAGDRWERRVASSWRQHRAKPATLPPLGEEFCPLPGVLGSGLSPPSGVWWEDSPSSLRGGSARH